MDGWLGLPIYFNFLTVTAFVPALACISGVVFLLFISNKSRSTWYLIFSWALFALFQLAYAFVASVYHPIGALHRCITVPAILLANAAAFGFFGYYRENLFPRLTRVIVYGITIVSILVTIWFIFSSLNQKRILRPSGLLYDFDNPLESAIVGVFILFFAITNVFGILAKIYKLQATYTAKIMSRMVWGYSFTIVFSVLNLLARKGVIGVGFLYVALAIGISVGFFIVFVVYISHTDEKSTVIGSILGIGIVIIVVLYPGLCHYVLKDHEEAYISTWQERVSNTRDFAEFKNLIGIISDDGRVFYARAKMPPIKKINFSELPSNISLSRSAAAMFIPGKVGSEKVAIVVDPLDFKVYLHKPSLKLFYALVIVVVLFSVTLPFFLNAALLRPLSAVLQGVFSINRGRYGHRIDNKRSDELGIISQSFNRMAQTIENATTNLERTVEKRTAQLISEKEKSETLLLNILPAEIAEELKERGQAKPVRIRSATVIFTDFVGFTKIAEDFSPEDVVAELDKCFTYFDQVTEKYGLEKLKTIGDAFMCAGGLPVENKTHSIDCCMAALEIQAFMKQMKKIKEQQGLPYWRLRLGINTGPLVAGVVGTKKFAYDVWGDTVNTASRMESSGVSEKINISRATYEQVKYFFNCEYRGKIKAKNKGNVDMYFLNGLRARFSINGEGKVPNREMLKWYVQIRRGKRIGFKRDVG